MIKSFLNLKGHQNPIGGSKVTAILLKGWIWPIGEALQICIGPTIRIDRESWFLPYARFV